MKSILLYFFFFSACSTDEKQEDAQVLEPTTGSTQPSTLAIKPRAYDKSYIRSWNKHTATKKASHSINADFVPAYTHPEHSRWPRIIFEKNQQVQIVEKRDQWARTHSNLWIPTRYLDQIEFSK